LNLAQIVFQQLVKAKSRGPEDSSLPPRFKPSSLGTPCLRKLYYSYHRVPVDFDDTPKLCPYAHIGDAAHEKISEMLRREGMLIDYYNPDGSDNIRFGEVNKEFPLKDKELEVSAMIDGVLNMQSQLWLGEWKTCGLKAFGRMNSPKPEHLVQGCTYLYLFNKALADGQFKHIKELEGFDR